MVMNLAKARHLCKLSEYAYIYSTQPPRVHVPKHLERLNNRAILITDPVMMKQTVAIRGSMMAQCTRDVWMNAHVTPASWLGCQVHGGYLHEAHAVYRALAHHLVPYYELEFTGHSSGGCIGVILAMMHHDKTGFACQTTGFGVPRFILTEEEPPVRVVCINDPKDPVPRIPIWSYKRIGQEVILPSTGDAGFHLKFHEMGNYRAKLSAMRELA
jgi:hypothetical protein